MPDPLLHYIVSFIVAKRRYRILQALLISLVGIVPDLDVVFHIHRSATHSLVILCIVAFLIYVFLKLFIKNSAKAIAILGTCVLLYLLHILMDIFTGLTPLLWPITNYALFIDIRIDFTMGSSPCIDMPIRIVIKPYTMEMYEVIRGSIATPISIALATALAITISIQSRTHYKHYFEKALHRTTALLHRLLNKIKYILQNLKQ